MDIYLYYLSKKKKFHIILHPFQGNFVSNDGNKPKQIIVLENNNFMVPTKSHINEARGNLTIKIPPWKFQLHVRNNQITTSPFKTRQVTQSTPTGHDIKNITNQSNFTNQHLRTWGDQKRIDFDSVMMNKVFTEPLKY